MKQSPVNRIVLATGLGLFAVSLCTAVVAGEVYQWKDAKGVTQYSSTPPPKGAFKVRTINNQGAAATATTVANAKSAENPQCGMARSNVAALQGKGAVQQDSDGDGKPDKTLSDSERASQLGLALSVMSANNCAASAAAPNK
ncbi:MAG: DUF4124 domain-containing protein [Lysobacter sp.]|nr:DUF4124 domain-containing protein [Lysobacter sp.]